MKKSKVIKAFDVFWEVLTFVLMLTFFTAVGIMIIRVLKYGF